jgi:hypothetical protein
MFVLPLLLAFGDAPDAQVRQGCSSDNCTRLWFMVTNAGESWKIFSHMEEGKWVPNLILDGASCFYSSNALERYTCAMNDFGLSDSRVRALWEQVSAEVRETMRNDPGWSETVKNGSDGTVVFTLSKARAARITVRTTKHGSLGQVIYLDIESVS